MGLPFRKTNVQRSLENRREFYRVVFPPGKEIYVQIEGLSFPLRDISLTGMRIASPHVPSRAGTCCGLVIWSDASVCPFTAWVHRRHRGFTALYRVEGIPHRQIIREQQRLLRS